MDDGVKFYRGMFILGLVFVAGFASGYQFRSWRAEWLKRRREKLAVKLRETQKQIDNLS